ncbi:MAG: T9SS type A sorting domain-containing protein [Bacteroidales bacterium]|nr:T9SS type A sorting domain-containing protein [Bacteroidales bacterium]
MNFRVYEVLKFAAISAISLLHTVTVIAQVPTTGDCLGAIPVCEAYYFQPSTPNGVGNYPNEVGTGQNCPYDCLWGERNSVWYIFTVQESGILSFIITPVDLNDDYDWALYNLTMHRCENIVSQMSIVTSSCNSAGGVGLHGATGAYNGADDCAGGGTYNGNTQWNANIPVEAGQTFVLYISDWTQSPTGYSLDLSPSTAVIFDDVPPHISSVNTSSVSGCADTTLNITFSENVGCLGVSPYLFSIDGPGGPYQVTAVTGPACSVGGEWEKDFTLTVDHPFTSNGTYTLYLAMGFPGIQDACNNNAPSDTITFYLNLGAPEVDESGLSIGDATCGMDNGYITGLQVNNPSGLTFIWKNSQGAVVGNEIDLLDVPAESYTLEVNDLNDCITIVGPYVVSELGAPDIDDGNMVITPSNYGADNGSITGIIINTPATITEYIWTNDNAVVVGNALDLSGVPSGYYELTVIDENSCEAHAGPYFVGEIGGPLTANPIASPDTLCKGASTTLSPGAGGGSGEYTFLWSSTPGGFNSNLQHPVVEPIENTTYHVEVFDGYITVSGDVDVYVNQLPVPNAGTDQSIPHGTSTTLHGSGSTGSGNYAYNWSPIDKLVDATVQDPQTKNLYTSTPFFLMIEDLETGCLSEDPDDVNVNITGGILSANPSSSPDSVFCLGEDFWLHANGGGGSGEYTYNWASNPAMDLPDQASINMDINIPGTYTFTVNIFDGYNYASGSVVVIVLPMPVIDLGPSVQTHCMYDTITLDAGNPGAEYLWSNGATTQTILVGTTGLGYIEQQYSVSVTNAEGCQTSGEVTLIFDYDACLGIGEAFQELNARIYPNPNNGIFTVEIQDVDSPVHLSVYNVLGSLRYKETIIAGSERKVQKEIDLASLPGGLYVLKIQTDTGLKIFEVILK